MVRRRAMAGRHGFWKFTAARAHSIRKAQAIRAARMRGKGRGPRSADTLGKYARQGLKASANAISFGVAGKLSNMIEPVPGGKKKWYSKIGNSSNTKRDKAQARRIQRGKSL